MKKYILYLTLLIGSSHPVYSQLADGSFEHNTSNCNQAAPGNGCPEEQCNAFWFASHGTPQIFRKIPNDPPPHKDNYAFMWTKDDGRGEGFFTNYKFLAGQSYQITFWLRTPPEFGTHPEVNGRMMMFAANGLTPTTTCNQSIPTTNVTKVQIASVANTTTTWVRHSITFSPTSTWDYLWIYPDRVGTLGSQYNIHVDMICIWGVTNTCPIDFKQYTQTINGTGILTPIRANRFELRTTIMSIGPVQPAAAPASPVHLQSGRYVEIKKVFDGAGSSQVFLASVKPCDEYTYNCYYKFGEWIVTRTNPENGVQDSVRSDSIDFTNEEFSGHPQWDSTEGGPTIERKRGPTHYIGGKDEIYSNNFFMPSSGSGRIAINLPRDGNRRRIRVLDTNGKMIKQIELNPSTERVEIDVSTVANGIYFIEVISLKETKVLKIAVAN